MGGLDTEFSNKHLLSQVTISPHASLSSVPVLQAALPTHLQELPGALRWAFPGAYSSPVLPSQDTPAGMYAAKLSIGAL